MPVKAAAPERSVHLAKKADFRPDLTLDWELGGRHLTIEQYGETIAQCGCSTGDYCAMRVLYCGTRGKSRFTSDVEKHMICSATCYSQSKPQVY